VSYEEFCEKVSILDIMDTSGTFAVRSSLDDFINRVSKKDNRKTRIEEFKRRLFRILVTDAERALEYWYNKYASLPNQLSHYFEIPSVPTVKNGEFDGRSNSRYGRLCKNINLMEFYSTKKLYVNDSEYCLGLMKAAFEDFKIRNSIACPAFFDQLCASDDYGSFWTNFMIGANKPSVFNPSVYLSMLDSLFEGKTLFAPVSGWNAYQLAFYSSKFDHFITTDVIPSVVENGKWLQDEYTKYQSSRLVGDGKTSHHYLCPSQKLQDTDFLNLYSEKVDAVLFSPPYFNLEIYRSGEQSISDYSNYSDWLIGYWEKTIMLCVQSMKRGSRFGFVISNYTTKEKQKITISEDMAAIAEKHMKQIARHRVRWSAIAVSRQAKKTRGGNYEDLWLYEKQ
jgi:hypothetical protein